MSAKRAKSASAKRSSGAGPGKVRITYDANLELAAAINEACIAANVSRNFLIDWCVSRAIDAFVRAHPRPSRTLRTGPRLKMLP